MNKHNNKQIMRLWTLIVSVLCFSSFAFAQSTVFTGKVVDEKGSPMPGVNVTAKGTTAATITNFDGGYSLTTEAPAQLSFTFVGYQTAYVSASEANVVNNVTLYPLEAEMISGAYRMVDKQYEMVGMTSLNYNDVIEKSYFTYPFTDLNSFVSGGADTWGGSYLVFVDGAPRAVDNIKPDEIESVTFLKGANASVLYGSHASKGAVVITTKRGKEGDIRFNIRANTGWNVAKSYPEYVGAAEYMKLYNKACENDGLAKKYSDTDIYNYASGTNPYRYPDVNFYTSEYLKKAYNRSDVTAEIDGGNDRAQYYTNISYYRVGNQFKKGEASKSYTERFNVRGNVNINISDYIKSHVDANVTFYNSRGYTGTNFWTAASTWRPNRIAPFIPVEYIDENADDALVAVKNSAHIIDGKFIAGTQSDPTNVFADLYVSGKSKWTSRQLQFETGLDIDLSPLAEGLSFHTQFAMDYATSYTQSYTNSYESFSPVWSNYNGKDVIVAFEKNSDGGNITATQDKHSGVQNVSGSDSDQTYTFDAHFNYDRTFDDHTIGAVAVVRGFQYRRTGEYHSESDASVGLNVHYDFAKRFFADVNASIVHTAKLAEGHRNAVSPAVTLGWNLTKESFLDGGLFNKLMLSVEAANVANDQDIDGYNLYTGTYSETGAWWAWTDQSQQSTVSKRGENKDLDFIRNKEIALRLTGAILDNKLTFDISAYRNKQEGLIITYGSQLPEYMMSYYPESSFISNINYNDNLRQGLEVSLGTNLKLGEVDFSALATAAFYTNEALKRDDTAYEYDYQKRQGKYLDGMWGYECLGFITTQDEIDAANGVKKIDGIADQTSFGSKIAAGDLKYKDQNGDGKIDSNDQVELGRWGSKASIGLGLTAKYQNFTLFVAGNGYFGGLSIKDGSYYWMSGEDKYSVMAREAWTTENPNATLPRLSTYGAQNNKQTSDFWTFKNNQFNISKVQLTYDIPLTGIDFLDKASVYVSGENLLKISAEREYQELNVGSAPQNRFYNLGVKVTF